MPAAIKYLEPNDKDRKALGGDQERSDRTTQFHKNLKYYQGNHPEWLLQDPSDPVNDNIVINVTKEAVDRTLTFLFPDMPSFQLNKNAQTPDEAWLNQAWLMNGGVMFLAIVAQNGALSGHNYVRVLLPDDPTAIFDYPRMVNINPTVPITYWKADDPDTIIWHELVWTVGKTQMLQDIINNNGSWTMRQYSRKLGLSAWHEDINGLVEWNSPYPPIISWPHLPNPNSFYGLAEITDTTINLNDSINRTASDIGKILRYHASPKTVGTGIAESDIKDSRINSLYLVENADAKLFNLEMHSDLASSMNFLDLLSKSFFTLTRTVVMQGTIKDFQRVTNTGIRAVFFDMISKNNVLRWTYGKGLQKLSQTMLFVAQKSLAFIPTVNWPEPLPSDPLEEVNKFTIEQANHWNNPITIAKSLGIEWDENVENWNKMGDYAWFTMGTTPKQAPTSNSNSSLNDQHLNNGAM